MIMMTTSKARERVVSNFLAGLLMNIKFSDGGELTSTSRPRSVGAARESDSGKWNKSDWQTCTVAAASGS